MNEDKNLLKKLKKEKSEDINSDALEGYGTVKEWEEYNGRGFWGNPTSGYLTDDEVENM